MLKALGLLLLVVALFVFHNDVWNREPQLVPTAGWLPADMTYRLGWLVAASIVLGILLRVTWKQAR